MRIAVHSLPGVPVTSGARLLSFLTQSVVILSLGEYRISNCVEIKCMYVCMDVCMTTSMYCLYVGVDYTYIAVNALAQGIKSFFGFKPLLGLEPMAPIRPQLLVSHANHSATET